jgi:hypothetical protein
MSLALALSCPTHGGSSKECPCKQLTVRASVWSAAELGDASRVREIIAKRGPDCLDAYGYTPLHYASQHGRLDVVNVLLSSGAAVDGIAKEAGGCGGTPLHRAAYSGQMGSVASLIQASADVNARDESFGDGRTPLHKAASQLHIPIVKALLQKGARASALDAEGLAPIHVLPQVTDITEKDIFHLSELLSDDGRLSLPAERNTAGGTRSTSSTSALVARKQGGQSLKKGTVEVVTKTKAASTCGGGMACPACARICLVMYRRQRCKCGELCCQQCLSGRHSCK